MTWEERYARYGKPERRSNESGRPVERRRVALGEWAKGRGATKLWAFSQESFARALGVSLASVRAYITHGDLDPGDLASLIRLYERRRKPGL